MNELPRGTVAFLMSDIEGSTRLVRDLGAAFPDLLSKHFELVGDAVTFNGGTLVSSEGDSTFAVFPSTRQAVAAAVAAQRALQSQAWPGGARVRVRMGIHAGEAVFGGRDYTGIDVHRTARIMGAGHGGQILISATARSLAGDEPGLGFRDLGSHELRDMPEPERLHQVTATGLPSDFPALRTVAAATPSNLPAQLTRFIGRAQELGTIGDLLGGQRLVTLTGPGGTGKTRLAIEAARQALPAFSDGVWFVPLDLLRDPALVLPTVATAVGVPETPGTTPASAIAERLAGKRTLLVLDNLEQVIAAAQEIGALLVAIPALTILATSREPLGIAGEILFAVPPLALPAEPGRPTAAMLAANDCVALFIERARASRADFALTDANAPAIAAICRRLDGLPLALELAAARISVISPEQILARMDHRLSLLASSRRDLTERQRTLRGAIEWSYELLPEPERVFFRRFSVFAGGADFDAAQSVIDPDVRLGADALELATGLVDRSLLRSEQHGEANRLEMLETLREYAADRLAADSTERNDVRRRHADWFRALAERSEDLRTDPRRDAILAALERELPNLRSAIASAREDGDVVTAVRIAVALREFWNLRNHLTEGRRILVELQAEAANLDPRLATRLVLTSAELASWQMDRDEAIRLSDLGLAMADTTGDRRLLAIAEQGAAWANVAIDPELARDRFVAAARLARELDEGRVLQGALQGLAIVLMRLGDTDAARSAIDESIAIAEANGDRFQTAMNVISRGFLAARTGDRPGSLRDFERAIRECQTVGAAIGITIALDAFAVDALQHGEPIRAATLAAGAQRLRTELGGGPSVSFVGLPDPLEAAKATVTPEVYDRASAAGRGMSTDDLVAMALSGMLT